MPYRIRRDCPICYKRELLKLSEDLSQVHQLTSEERKPLLKVAVFSHQVTSYMMPNIVPTGVPQGLSAPPIMPQGSPPTAPHVVSKAISKRQASPCLEKNPILIFGLKINFLCSWWDQHSVEKHALRRIY